MLESLRAFLDEHDRLALLAHLKEIGVEKLGHRQKIANVVGRLARERAPASAPAASSSSHMPDLPLVFIHTGLQRYVELAVRASAQRHTPVFVIGDASMATLAAIDGVEFVDIEPFRREAGV